MNKLFNSTEIVAVLEALPKRYRTDVWLRNFAKNYYSDIYKFHKL